MSHLRMGASPHHGGDRRAIRMGHSRLSAVSRNPPEVARSSKLVLGFRAGYTSLEGNPLVTGPIGICTLQPSGV
jgi:hypothetical protein